MVRTSWANDDDDGTLDVNNNNNNNNNEALTARPRQASETGIVGPSSSQAQLSIRTRPLPAQPESTQPSKRPSSLLGKSGLPPSSEQEAPRPKLQATSVHRLKKSESGASSTADPTRRTTEDGASILKMENTWAKSSGMKPEIWKVFAETVVAANGPQVAADLLRPPAPASEEDDPRPRKKHKKRRK